MWDRKKLLVGGLSALVVGALFAGCTPKKEALKTEAVGAGVAEKVYIPPGKYDEF
jgi:nitrous-oxide reductase